MIGKQYSIGYRNDRDYSFLCFANNTLGFLGDCP